MSKECSAEQGGSYDSAGNPSLKEGRNRVQDAPDLIEKVAEEVKLQMALSTSLSEKAIDNAKNKVAQVAIKVVLDEIERIIAAESRYFNEQGRQAATRIEQVMKEKLGKGE